MEFSMVGRYVLVMMLAFDESFANANLQTPGRAGDEQQRRILLLVMMRFITPRHFNRDKIDIGIDLKPILIATCKTCLKHSDNHMEQF